MFVVFKDMRVFVHIEGLVQANLRDNGENSYAGNDGRNPDCLKVNSALWCALFLQDALHKAVDFRLREIIVRDNDFLKNANSGFQLGIAGLRDACAVIRHHFYPGLYVLNAPGIIVIDKVLPTLYHPLENVLPARQQAYFPLVACDVVPDSGSLKLHAQCFQNCVECRCLWLRQLRDDIGTGSDFSHRDSIPRTAVPENI